MGRNRSSSILITEIYEGSTRRINVHDERSGEMRSATVQYPCSAAEFAEVKARLIAEVKGEPYEGDRHSEASMPELASAPSAA